MPNRFNRRIFFRRCAAGASLALMPASVSAGCSPSSFSPSTAYPASPVIVARSDRLKATAGRADGNEVRRLLDKAVVELTGAENAQEGWRSLFSPRDIVGLKLNCLAPGIAPRPEVTEAIIRGLGSAGIPGQNVIIWDRTRRELERCGYRIAEGRGSSVGDARCFGTDAFGAGYEQEPEIIGEVGGCFSRILTRICTALINVPVLKDHDLAGISASMKNNYGVIHNPNRYHDNNCDPYVAHLNSVGHLVNKQRLIICDAVTAQCHAGPAYKPAWAWNYGGLLVSRDPVALDTIGADIIETRRREKDLPSLAEANRPPRWLATAHSMGLGNGELNSIRVVEVG